MNFIIIVFFFVKKMKILAKERLLARQLPPELFELKGNDSKYTIAQYFKYLGIDLNTSPYEQVSSSSALKIIKSSNALGALLCLQKDNYSKKYNYVLITAHKDFDTNRVKVHVDRASYRVQDSIKNIINDSTIIYFFKGNQKTKDALDQLDQTRRENSIPQSQRRLGRDNTPRPYYINKNEYDKSGYEKRNLQVDLAEKRSDKAVEKAVKCVQGICKINKEEATKYLDLLTVKADRWWHYDSNMSRLADTLNSIDKYLKVTCKVLGFNGYISFYILADLSRDTSGREDIINFVYSLDVSAFLRVYRKLISDELSKI